MNIFVGNLSFDTTEAHLKKLFEGFGVVVSVVIVMDEKGIKSRGFGFLEMSYGQQAQKAIAALDGREFMGRPIKVSQAQPKSEKAREIGDLKEMRKRIKAQKRQMSKQAMPTSTAAGRSRDFEKKARLSVAERRQQPKPWEKRQAGVKSWKKIEIETRLAKGTRAKSRPWERRHGLPKM